MIDYAEYVSKSPYLLFTYFENMAYWREGKAFLKMHERRIRMKNCYDGFVNLIMGLLGSCLLNTVWYYHTVGTIVVSSLDVDSWTFAIGFLLSYPWKIGENVYSLFGGWNDNGKVYSIIEIHANCENASSFLVFSFFTCSEKVISLIGFKFFCKETDESVVFLGLNICSRSEGLILTLIGGNILCHSDTIVATFGGNVLSKSDDETATILGVNLASSAGRLLWTGAGVTALSHSKDVIVTLVGIPLFCYAKKALLGFGIPFFPNIRKDGEFKISFTEARAQLPIF